MRPSVQNGYAKNAGESEYPSLWHGILCGWGFGVSGVTGSAIDLSGRQRHGSINGGPLWEITEYGDALHFDGDNDYITLPISSSDFGTRASLFIRLRLDVNTPTDGAQSGLTLIGTSASADHYPFTNGVIFSGVWRDDRLSVGSPSGSRTAWHTIAITNSPGTNGWKFWINGSVFFQTTGESSIFVAENPLIGQGISGQNIDGYIAEVLVYNRELSGNEISTLNAIPYAPFVQRRRIYVASGGSEPTTLTPATAAIPVSSVAPTLSSAITISPAPVATPISTALPTVQSSASISPESVSVGAQLQAPTLTANATLSPSAVSSPILAVAPTVVEAGTLSPPSLSIQVVADSPTLIGSISKSPASASLGLVAIAPTLSSSVTISPATVAVGIQTTAPTLPTGNVISPVSVSAGMVTIAPGLLVGGITKTPAAVAIGIPVQATTIASGSVLSPISVDVALSILAPSLVYASVAAPASLLLPIVIADIGLSIGGITKLPASVSIGIQLVSPQLIEGLVPSGGLLYDSVDIEASIAVSNINILQEY